MKTMRSFVINACARLRNNVARNFNLSFRLCSLEDQKHASRKHAAFKERFRFKPFSAAFLIALIIGGSLLVSVTNFGVLQSSALDDSSFKVSGYILDSNGCGIANAQIIFNVPQVIPSVFSDSSGHYTISAPAGTYHVNVWPPFDSNFIYYDETGFIVDSDIAKNITMTTGYKVSGYVFDSLGRSVKGAIVSFKNVDSGYSFLSGYYSNSLGYYFASAPGGTYKLSVTPRSGYNHFNSYFEPNFIIDSNLARNITISSPATSSNILNLELQPKYDGKTLFTNEKIHTSPKSVRLIIPENATKGSYAMALYPYGGTLSSISTFSIFTSYTHARPRFMLCLEKNGHGWADTFLLSDYQPTSNGQWKATSGGNGIGWTETNIQLTNYGSLWNTTDYWKIKYGNLKVWYIGILLECEAISPDGFGEPLYTDELILNGIKYNIAPYSEPEPQPTPSPTPSSSSFKISGYILDSNGRGIKGANIIFNAPSIVPSAYSDASGCYVISAPAGIYHVNIWPPFDSNYINYDESEFVVKSDMTKNITLYSGYKVSGYISDTLGKPIMGAVVLLNNFGSGRFSNDAGYYYLSVPAGTYTINIHPRSGYNYSGPTTDFPAYYESSFIVSSNTVKNITVGTLLPAPSPNPIQTPKPSSLPSPTLTTMPAWVSISADAANQSVFLVESNSTVSALAFNSTSQELSFDVTGPSGTAGYVKTAIAKNLISDVADIKVYLDGKQLDYTLTSTSDSWVLAFNYYHSSHQVKITLLTNMATSIPAMGLNYWVLIALAAVIFLVGIGVLATWRTRKTRTKNFGFA